MSSCTQGLLLQGEGLVTHTKKNSHDSLSFTTDSMWLVLWLETGEFP